MSTGLKTHWKIALVLFAAALLLSGCAFSRNALVGSWIVNDSGLTMVFTAEGKLRLLPPAPTADAAASAPAEITYRFIDDTSITISPAGVLNLNENVPVPFEISGDTLTLQLAGQPIVLTRAP